jgi:hypothetical protein
MRLIIRDAPEATASYVAKYIIGMSPTAHLNTHQRTS